MSLKVEVHNDLVIYETGSQQPRRMVPIESLANNIRKMSKDTTIHNLDADPAYQNLTSPEKEAVRAYFSSILILVRATFTGSHAQYLEKLQEDLHWINLHVRYG